MRAPARRRSMCLSSNTAGSGHGSPRRRGTPKPTRPRKSITRASASDLFLRIRYSGKLNPHGSPGKRMKRPVRTCTVQGPLEGPSRHGARLHRSARAAEPFTTERGAVRTLTRPRPPTKQTEARSRPLDLQDDPRLSIACLNPVCGPLTHSGLLPAKRRALHQHHLGVCRA